MGLYVGDQLRELLYAALMGVILGVFYDVLAIIRSYIKANKLINFVFDVLFWLFAIVALFAFVLIFTKGEMRWYVLLGNFFGIFLYKNTISPLFFRAIRIIIALVVKGLHGISRPLYAFLSWIYRKCRRGSEKNGKKKKETQE